MKKKLVFGSMLMVLLGLALVLAGCDTGGGGGGGNPPPPPPGGDAEWDGEYWEDNSYRCKGTLNLAAKTLTVIVTGSNQPPNSNYVPFSYTDVAIGPATDVAYDGGSLQHSGKWAYVYNGSTKIGVIYTHTISTIGSYWSETNYSLRVGGNGYADAFLAEAEAGSPPLDLSDSDDTYGFWGDKE